MNLLQEYKELYYQEIEFNNRLNNKISTTLTFLTIIGSALIILWTQFKYYELYWYTGVYLVFCIITTIMFCICIFMFFKTYSSSKKVRLYPITEVALQNSNVLNTIAKEQESNAYCILEIKMAERFINDAIYNRELNIAKNNKHNILMKMIMATFIITFISFAINISIDYYETNFIAEELQQIYINGGEINVR